MFIQDAKKMTMEMKRMVHHGCVDESNSNIFTMTDFDHIGFSKHLVVKGPDIALHIACQR